MSETMRKLSACLCLLGAIALAAPACGPGGSGKSNGSQCAEGEKLAEVNGTEDCYAECDNGMCDAGFTCNTGLCIPDDSGNNDGNNSNSNSGTNSDANSDTNSDSNSDTNANAGTNSNAGTNNANNEVDPALQEACEQAADKLFGSCISDNCTVDAQTQSSLDMEKDGFLNGGGQTPPCAERASQDQQFEDFVNQIAAETCDNLSPLRCGTFGLYEECGCELPGNIGAACTMDDQCMSGDLNGGCATEEDTSIPGGYCVARPCPIPFQGVPDGFAYQTDGCGTDNVCQIFVDPQAQTPSGICIRGCDAGCDREGYTCSTVHFTQNDEEEFVALQTCEAACEADDDCRPNVPGLQDVAMRCNTDTGQCEFACGDEAIGQDAPTPTEICNNSGGTCTAGGGGEFCVL